MNKNESKYFNTARKMDEALIALLEKKDFAFITVKDICEMAGVNRSTFYLHYETIQDLLSETVEYLNGRFHSYFSETAEEIISNISDMPLESLILVREKYLVPYLRYIRENKKVYAVTHDHKQVMRSNVYGRRLHRYIINPIMDRFRVPENQKAYYSAFFVHGILAVVQEWLKNGCREEPEEISEIIESLCIREK